MVGCVGGDDPGRQLLESLDTDRVGRERVARLANSSTGFAAIAVGPDGENQIVVSSGANNELGPDQVDAAGPQLAAASVVLAQFETPLTGVLAAAKQAVGTFVLNPAPAPASLDTQQRAVLDQLLAEVAIVVPNQGELATLLGEKRAESLAQVAQQAEQLAKRGPHVVVTLGEQGALVVTEAGQVHVPALAVEAIDATAAGDSFCAALADALCAGLGLVEAAEWAVRVAAVTVTRRGAQASLPTRDEVSAAGV